MKQIILRIKRQEGPLFSRLYRLGKTLLDFSLPLNHFTKAVFKAIFFCSQVVLKSFYWIVRVFWIEPIFKSRCLFVGENVIVTKMPFIVGQGDIEIGHRVLIEGKVDIFFNDKVFDSSVLKIGNDVFIGHFVSIAIAKQVLIGNNVLISGNVVIADNDGHPLDFSERRRGFSVEAENCHDVKVGNDVWIGRDVKVLKGVSIGDRSVVGAGAVVTTDIPPDCVVAGNPARIVKRLDN